MESEQKSSSFHESDNEQSSFQKRVKSFLSFNFFIFILMLFGIKIAILWKISIIWGAFLAFTAWSSNSGNCSRDRSKSQHNEEQSSQSKRPNWRDKDLV